MVDNLPVGRSDANGRRYPKTPCPSAAPDGDPLLQPTVTPQKYDKAVLSYAESARLIRAKVAAEAAVSESQRSIQQATELLAHSWQRAAAAVRAIREFRAERRLGLAAKRRRKVLDRHIDDGPEDRRSRPRWLTEWLVWLIILLSAGYDTAFFATVFQDAIDIDPQAPILLRAVAYIPGFSIAMALILAGSWLAVPLFRHRSSAERRARRGPLNWRVVLSRTFRNWRPDEQTRRNDDLPWPSWPLAVTFLLLLLSVLGVWAWFRGRDLFDGNLRWPLVVLLLLLTGSAIAFKAAAHNPFADRDRETREDLARTQADLAALERGAGESVAELLGKWQEAQLTLENATLAARRPIVEAWASISEERARHGLAGNVAPSFVASDGQDTVGFALFDDLREPRVHVRVLDNGWAALADFDPARLQAQLADTLDQLHDQLDRAMETDSELHAPPEI
ncbi:hypothetical protein DFJ67_5878 [Asanoa ferruginea]|uniref:Uncharacterized protein n=1 Tax=Asanoa ferruginea TaxID=53367 RepID=A0A3D9ZT95_9ACTN|nr:hypothetical protein [Asanoa ferruginea]REF99834.1 hypothetical protein DFJ67_5878 [Asanoa ferruginea]GIF51852.1 hypothetical protein Afe04nite_63910 [Asanoa ferruginea]